MVNTNAVKNRTKNGTHTCTTYFNDQNSPHEIFFSPKILLAQKSAPQKCDTCKRGLLLNGKSGPGTGVCVFPILPQGINDFQKN